MFKRRLYFSHDLHVVYVRCYIGYRRLWLFMAGVAIDSQLFEQLGLSVLLLAKIASFMHLPITTPSIMSTSSECVPQGPR